MTRVFFNRSLALFIIVINIYFVKATANIINTDGGPMGITLIGLPIFVYINAFIIPAFLTIFRKLAENKLVLILNIIGTISIFLLVNLTS